MFSCLSLSCAIIFPSPSALFSYLSRLACPHYSFPTLCFVFLSSCLSRLVCSHSFSPCICYPFPPFSILPFRFFFLSHTSLFRPSPFFPLRILPFFHPLVYPLFFHPHTSFFLLSAPSTLSFSFSSLYSSRLFCSPFSFIPFLSYTHSHTSLPPLSPVLAFLTFFLSPLFHIHRPFFRASRCPSLQKQSCRSFLYGTKKRKTAASRFLIATIC